MPLRWRNIRSGIPSTGAAEGKRDQGCFSEHSAKTCCSSATAEPPQPGPPAATQLLPAQPAVTSPHPASARRRARRAQSARDWEGCWQSRCRRDRGGDQATAGAEITPPDTNLKQLSLPHPALQPAAPKSESMAVVPQAVSKAPEIASVEKPAVARRQQHPQRRPRLWKNASRRR